MGNTPSCYDIKCEICKIEYGPTAILNISDPGNLGGHNICVDCYPEVSINTDKFKNEYFTKMQCEWCKYKTSSKNNIRPVFKIFWYGKFGGNSMCQKCLYNKEFRRTHR